VPTILVGIISRLPTFEPNQIEDTNSSAARCAFIYMAPGLAGPQTIQSTRRSRCGASGTAHLYVRLPTARIRYAKEKELCCESPIFTARKQICVTLFPLHFLPSYIEQLHAFINQISPTRSINKESQVSQARNTAFPHCQQKPADFSP
jgi:hypothetical protein